MRRNFCNGLIQSVRDEVDPQLVFFMIRPGFSCMEKVILRTVDTGVQKVKDLFTDPVYGKYGGMVFFKFTQDNWTYNLRYN
jgi:hypothetical protein